MRIPQRGERGFTLIELLIVIAIIGVIAAIAVPIFLNQDDSAENAALEAELSSAMDLLALGTGLGSPLPSSFPAGQVTTIPGAGSFQPSVTINVDGSGDTLCVDGTTPAGTTISLGLTSGLQTSDCATANPTAPDAPTDVAAVLASATSLEVTFTAGAANGAAITSFTATCTSGDGGVTGSASAAASPITVGSLTAGATYTCVVTGTNSAGTSPASTASAPVQLAVPPDAVSDLSATSAANNSVVVSWTSPSTSGAPISSYTLEESTDQVTWTQLSNSLTSTTYTQTDVPGGQTIYFRVYATSPDGTSNPSNIASVVVSGPAAIGGTVTQADGYWIHTFTSDGTFTPAPNLQVEAVVVGGGEDGDWGNIGWTGAGGNGGQVLTGTVTLNSTTSITVGAIGGDSSIQGHLTAIGGGGAAGGAGVTDGNGLPGGDGVLVPLMGARYGAGGGSAGITYSLYSPLPVGGAGGLDGGGAGGAVNADRYLFQNGSDATGYGNGGGGGRVSYIAPGSGTPGIVIIYYPV